MSYILSWNLRETLTYHMYLNTDLVEITLFSYKLALIYERKCKLLFCYYPYLIIS